MECPGILVIQVNALIEMATDFDYRLPSQNSLMAKLQTQSKKPGRPWHPLLHRSLPIVKLF